MGDFYDKLKKYGDLYLTHHTQDKPTPVDIDTNISNGFYWINNIDYLSKVGEKSTVVVSKDIYAELIGHRLNILVCENPRKTYSNILYDLYPEIFETPKLKQLEVSNKIGYNVYVAEDVKIGLNIKIGNNVTIYHNTVIGNNVVIGDNCVIGSKGVAFDNEKDDSLIMFPQIGGVRIGNNVEMGSFCDIKRGALKNTIISDGVKLGAYNNVGHNVFIGKNTFVSMRCNICGSVSIGDNSVLWVNSTIKHKINIPKRTKIGSNTYVDKNFEEEGSLLLGIPAKKILKNII